MTEPDEEPADEAAELPEWVEALINWCGERTAMLEAAQAAALKKYHAALRMSGPVGNEERRPQ